MIGLLRVVSSRAFFSLLFFPSFFPFLCFFSFPSYDNNNDDDVMGKDYYAILGVPKNADDDAIKKAYRKQGKPQQ